MAQIIEPIEKPMTKAMRQQGTLRRRFRQFTLSAATMLFMPLVAAPSGPSDVPSAPQGSVDQKGIVHGPAFDLPPSRYMSGEARHALGKELASQQPASPVVDLSKVTIQDVRKEHDAALAPILARLKIRYPTLIADRTISGIHIRVVRPKDGVSKRNAHRILLNLHGGGFFEGSDAEALVESIPIAAVAQIEVITIDYRQAPEYRFPAASDDVIAVYRQLLERKEVRAAGIGIYGCSAGGILTAQAAAAVAAKNLPRPGALGIFSAGAYADWNGDPLSKGTWGGDSRYWAEPISGQPGLEIPFHPHSWFDNAYISGVDLDDPLVSPAESPSTLAKFPPTLLLTGTRAYDLSALVETHRQLTKNGVQAELHLWDGLGHCFFFDPDLPESQEAYTVIANFFMKHLH
jgi:acetyl esterase/lipase